MLFHRPGMHGHVVADLFVRPALGRTGKHNSLLTGEGAIVLAQRLQESPLIGELRLNQLLTEQKPKMMAECLQQRLVPRGIGFAAMFGTTVEDGIARVLLPERKRDDLR